MAEVQTVKWEKEGRTNTLHLMKKIETFELEYDDKRDRWNGFMMHPPVHMSLRDMRQELKLEGNT
jgi:hypothetical protein